MREDYLELGPVPADEDCAQVGDEDYHPCAMAEARRYIETIRRKLGPEPKGARLSTKWNPHEMGDYIEVVVYFDESDGEAIDYAFRCESEGPQTWDNVAPAQEPLAA